MHRDNQRVDRYTIVQREAVRTIPSVQGNEEPLMSCSCKAIRRVLAFVTALACAGTVSWSAEPGSLVEPFTSLYDAPPASSVPLSEQSLSNKDGWSRLEEEDATHRFQGCAVLMNDKIVAVLHKDAPDVDVYSRQVQGLKLCARLQPICGEKGVRNRLSRETVPGTFLLVQENTRSSVSLQVGFRSPRNQPCQITYEMNVGEPFIKTTAGAGVEKLRVHAPCRFAVIPDFFGDDIVVDASAISVA